MDHVSYTLNRYTNFVPGAVVFALSLNVQHFDKILDAINDTVAYDENSDYKSTIARRDILSTSRAGQ